MIWNVAITGLIIKLTSNYLCLVDGICVVLGIGLVHCLVLGIVLGLVLSFSDILGLYNSADLVLGFCDVFGLYQSTCNILGLVFGICHIFIHSLGVVFIHGLCDIFVLVFCDVSWNNFCSCLPFYNYFWVTSLKNKNGGKLVNINYQFKNKLRLFFNF